MSLHSRQTKQELADDKCNSACQALLQRLRSGDPEWSTEALFADENSRFSKYKRYNVAANEKNDVKDDSDIDIVANMFARDNCRRSGLLKSALSLLGKTRAQLMQSSDTAKTIPYTSHCVFGSPDSTDIDVAYFLFTDEWGDLQNSLYDRSALLHALAAQGYDVVGRDCDVCLVLLDENKDVKRTSKGSCYETQNIIYYTHKYHGTDETNPCPIERPIDMREFDVLDKCRAVAKCFLDNLKFLVCKETYAAIKADRRQVYQTGGLQARALFVEKILPEIVVDWDQNNSLDQNSEIEWRDALKSLVMKLVQMLLLDIAVTNKSDKVDKTARQGEEEEQDKKRDCDMNALEYNKCLLPDRLREASLADKFDPEEVRYYLTRGKQGCLGTRQCFGRLTREFVGIVRTQAQNNSIEWSLLRCDQFFASKQEEPTLNPLAPRYDATFWRLFWATPNDPSATLVTQFLLTHPELETNWSLGPLFVFPSSTSEGLSETFIREHVHFEPQRSEEWKRLLSFYKCGRNTGIVPLPETCTTTQQYVRFYWNLIRGCLGEMIAQSVLDTSQIGLPNYRKVHVGLIVEEKNKRGSTGAAPDLLLVSPDGNEIVPVEIKCIGGPFAENGERRRAVQTARKQLRTSVDIIGDKTNRRGLLLFLHTEPNCFSLYWSLCNV